MRKILGSFIVLGGLLIVNNLLPFHAFAASSTCDVTGVTVPTGATIGADIITANVTYATSSVIVNVTTSADSTWKLYTDVNCTSEISTKKLYLSVGTNTGYIKVTAQDKTTTKKYTLTITRAPSNVCNVTAVISPSGATLTNYIKVNVPNATTSVSVDLTTSTNSTWKMYSDYTCTNEIIDKKINLKVGSNYGYIKVTAQDTTTTKVYMVWIIREQIHNVCDITAVNLPSGAFIGLNTITASVPIGTSSITLDVTTRKNGTWKLYRDVNCTNQIINNQLNLNVGINIAYIKVTAEDNTTTKKYTLTISEANIPNLTASDVTSKVNVLGQPFVKAIYPKNVWDMQVFNDKIYLGYGNSSNDGPSTNAGPVPIIYFDPPTGNFVTEDINRYNSTTEQYETVQAVDEEQIDIYRVLNGKLYTPGHDSKESWSFGNFYVTDGSGWQKFRTIPRGIHVYDIAYFKGKLFAGLGLDNLTSPQVLMSEDDGNTWKASGYIPDASRAYKLFEFKDKLYAIQTLRASKVPNYSGGYNSESAQLLCIEQDSTGVIKTSSVTVSGSKMIPGVDTSSYRVKIIRINELNNKLLFVTGEEDNDHQWLPGSLYVASDINSAQKVILPESTAFAMDTLIRGDSAYVLAHVKVSKTEYINIVYKSDDLNIWTEVFRFKQDTYARSFEELNGDFYFGLGCNTDYLPTSTGTILKVDKSAYTQVTNACDIVAVTVPTGASINGTTIAVSVANGTSSVTVNVTASADARWKLYSDAGCTSEITNKVMNLNVGVNTAYIKVTAQDGTTTKTYTLTVTRAAAPLSTACDITAVAIPSGAIIEETTITANVSNDISSVTTDVYTSSNAYWKLYSDLNCINEISSREIRLNEGSNTVYIEVTAEDNVTTKTYTLIVTRAQAFLSNTSDITEPEPSEDEMPENDLTENVPNDIGSQMPYAMASDNVNNIPETATDIDTSKLINISETESNITIDVKTDELTAQVENAVKAIESLNTDISDNNMVSNPQTLKKEIIIRISDVSAEKEIKVMLPKKVLDKNAQKLINIAIESKDVRFSLPIEALQVNELSQLEQAAKEQGKDICIEISKKSESEIAIQDSDMKPIGNTYEFRASAVMKNSSGIIEEESRKAITQFRSKISVKIKYTDQDVLGVTNFDKLGVYTLTENGEWKYVKSKIDKENKELIFNTPHFSKYAIMEYTKTFSDIREGNWAKEYVETLAARQITKGIDENNFVPTGTVTRAQFAAFIVRALGSETEQYKGIYTDIPTNAWYAGEVEAAQKVGLIQGVGEGKFNPNAEITREEMAVMIMRAYQAITKKDLTDEAKKSSASFKDSDNISDWAKEAVYAAQANNIINGMSADKFESKGKAQRNQVAKIIIEMLKAAGEM